VVEFCRLLDAGWIVQIMRGVDRRYHAFARRKDQRWADVMPQVDADVDMWNQPTLTRTSDGISCQCADADTPEAALRLLADSVFGLAQEKNDGRS
jgi:hypothetical protein